MNIKLTRWSICNAYSFKRTCFIINDDILFWNQTIFIFYNMNNWEQIKQFARTFNISGFELPKDQFKWIKAASHEAKQNEFFYSEELVGHIKEEYRITKISKSFAQYLLNCCVTPPVFDTWKDIGILSKSAPICVDSLWCNFQKKYEFNPPHSHSGIVSFVIFVQIPYDLKEEEKYFPDVARKGEASRFGFINSTPQGKIVSQTLPIDKTLEGKMLMFHASQMHYVNPFYTSDDYRITVSGNIKFKI